MRNFHLAAINFNVGKCIALQCVCVYVCVCVCFASNCNSNSNLSSGMPGWEEGSKKGEGTAGGGNKNSIFDYLYWKDIKSSPTKNVPEAPQQL